MRRSTKLAISVAFSVASAAVPSLACAQDNFPDIPANHWAYEALARMKQDGLLVGYPDGLFRGVRPASRYELAVAMNAVYTNLRSLLDSMDAQLKALQNVNPQDIQNLKDQVATLQNEVSAMKGWGDDIAALKKATEQFDKELRSLGVDVEAMKRDLEQLGSRVTALENRKPAVDISGDANFVALTGNSSGGRPGLTQDGRAVGLGGGAPIGLGHDLAILNETAFTFKGTNETGPKWHVTPVVSDMLGQGAFGSQSNLVKGGPTYGFQSGKEDVYLQDASVSYEGDISGLNYSVEAGRVARKVSPYLFQRIDNTPYFSNDRWDDGEYRFDGGILGFNLGQQIKLSVFGGNNSNLLSANGVDLNSTVISNNRYAGGLSESIAVTTTYPAVTKGVPNIIGDIDRTFGVDSWIGLGKNGHVTLAYLWLDQDSQNAKTGTDFLETQVADQDQLYGADTYLGFGRFKVEGGYHQSILTEAQHVVNEHDNVAWDGQISYTADRWVAWAGYREVDNNFYAPGDWGRLGILYNPGNVKGWQVGANIDLARSLRLSFHGEWDKGAHDEGNTSVFTASPFSSHSTIDSYIARLDYRVNPNLGLFASYEDTQIKSPAADFLAVNAVSGTPEYGWTTVGFKCGLTSSTSLTVQYQLSNVFNEPFLNPGVTRYTGGFLTTQLTVRF